MKRYEKRLITSKKIKPLMKETPGPGGLTAELIWGINAIFSGSFENIKVKEMLPNSFYRDNGTLATKPDKTLQKEEKGSISLINTDAKFFSKIIVKWIQECIRHLGIVVHAFNLNTLEVETRVPRAWGHTHTGPWFCLFSCCCVKNRIMGLERWLNN